MKRIIFYRGLSIDFNTFTPTNYEKIVENYHLNGGGNVGNKLFNQAAEKYITNEYTQYDYIYYDETNFCPIVGEVNFEMINEYYDLVIMPQANIFCDSPFTKKLLNMWSSGISNFKIPVYVLGVGIQVNKENEIFSLAKKIKKEAKIFIETVYKTGGEFSLRGYYTKSFFSMLGFNDAVVTGCPSFFQNGKHLFISNEKVSESGLRIALNGSKADFYDPRFRRIIQRTKKTYYLDQDEFVNLLYEQEFFKNFTFSKRSIMLHSIPLYSLKLICENQFFLFYDLTTRFQFFTEKQINFSYGKRIHGNIMAMLNGIPGYVVTKDLRTKELAEFFNIPYSEMFSKDIYETYIQSDYSKFNDNFPKLYDNFEKFLLDHKIIEKKLEFPNHFDEKIKSINWKYPVIINSDSLIRCFEKFKKCFHFYSGIEQIVNFYSRLKNKIL